MVKLDVSLLRFLEDEDFRVLTALEMACRNHVVAPTPLIEHIAQLPRGGCRKRLQLLLKHQMIHHESVPYDGYAMKYAAYDFLALNVLAKRGSVAGVGHRIGCGKESDIFIVEDANHNQAVLKLQRLGRCSFRSVTRNRDYKDGKGRHGASWFFLSRLAATKEFAFMKALFDEGFPVPKPIDHNRHAVVMEIVTGTLLNSIVKFESIDDAQKVYERCVQLAVRLAQHGLIHGDFNEFNIFVTDAHKIVLIDFPQMISTDHRNAADMFDRDVKNLAAFFLRRFKVHTLLYPKLFVDAQRIGALDKAVSASGAFHKGDMQAFEQLLLQKQEGSDSDDAASGSSGSTSQEEEADPSGCGDLSKQGREAEQEVGATAMSSEMVPIQSVTHGGAEELEGDEDTQEVSRLQDSAAVAKGGSSANNDELESREEEEEVEISDAEKAREANISEATDDSSGSGNVEDKSPNSKRPQRPLQKAVPNENFREDGAIDMDHIRTRVRFASQRDHERRFAVRLRRNIQKDRASRRIRRQLKSGGNEIASSMMDW